MAAIGRSSAVLSPVPSIAAPGLPDRRRRLIPDPTQPYANVLLAYPGRMLPSQRCGCPVASAEPRLLYTCRYFKIAYTKNNKSRVGAAVLLWHWRLAKPLRPQYLCRCLLTGNSGVQERAGGSPVWQSTALNAERKPGCARRTRAQGSVGAGTRRLSRSGRLTNEVKVPHSGARTRQTWEPPACSEHLIATNPELKYPCGRHSQKSVKRLTFSFRNPARAITLLHIPCINPFKFIFFCNSSPKSSHSLHDWLQIVFYAFRPLLTL
ncbi:hypothetical protein EC836_101912 [Erwinia sp. JUb26]|nr:hypothetical protein EC836_101912 [Erwinia sp. JUb26]